MSRKLKALMASVCIALPLAGQANDLPMNGWTEFYFAESGGKLLDKPAFDDTALPASFGFASSTPVLLRVTDLNFAGDQFQLLVDGKVLGQTSAPTGSSSTDLGDQYENAYTHPQGSHGAWFLQAGSHIISGTVLASPLGAGNGALQISPVPETDSSAMVVAGVGLVCAFLRRRIVGR